MLLPLEMQLYCSRSRVVLVRVESAVRVLRHERLACAEEDPPAVVGERVAHMRGDLRGAGPVAHVQQRVRARRRADGRHETQTTRARAASRRRRGRRTAASICRSTCRSGSRAGAVVVPRAEAALVGDLEQQRAGRLASRARCGTQVPGLRVRVRCRVDEADPADERVVPPAARVLLPQVDGRLVDGGPPGTSWRARRSRCGARRALPRSPTRRGRRERWV